MKMIYTHRTQGVGAEGAHIMGMAEAFRDLGHEVMMDCLPGCDPFEQKSSASARSNSKPKPSLLQRVYWAIADHAPQIIFESFEFAYNIPLAFRFGWCCIKIKPDFVYERYSLNTFAPSLICSIFGIHHILEVNDAVVIERSRPLSLKWAAAFCESYCLRKAELSITITEKFRSLLSARYQLGSGKIIVLTNAVSKRRFNKTFDRISLRKELNIHNGIVLGATGQFLDWHGLQSLVEILGAEAVEKNLYFLFIGDGPARKVVEEIAAQFQIQKRVVFTGMLPISEVPNYLSALDIAVIPNAAPHASPMKLIEYMAMGLPIIAPDLPSIRIVLEEKDLGFIFPAGEISVMRNLILNCLRNLPSAQEKGLRAKDFVFSHLTWQSHGEQILNRLKMK